MYNLESVRQVIALYLRILEQAKSQITILEKLDYEKYSTFRGIEEITFNDGLVNVKCDDTCRGCYDTHYFDFPLEWMDKSEEELSIILKEAREKEEETKRKAQEEKKAKEEKEREQREMETYLRLKEKFETKN